VIATVEQDEVIAVKEGDRVRLVAKSRPLFVKRVAAPNAPTPSGHDVKPKVEAGQGNVAATAATAAAVDDGDDDGDDNDGVVSADAAAGEPQRELGSGSESFEPTNEVAVTKKAKAGDNADSGNITVYKCPLCDVASENNIEVHMKKMHPACQLSPIKTTAVASFRCHKCPARFFLKAQGLTRHLLLQHGEKVKALPKRVKKAVPPKGGDHDDDADDPPSKRRRKPTAAAATAAVSSTARAPVVPTPAVPSPPVEESVRSTAPRPSATEAREPQTRPVSVAYGDLDPLMPSLFSAARNAAPPPRRFVQIVTFSSPDFDKQ
jgi:hypothetical protein